MDVIEAITKRYSCRAYQDRPIEDEKLTKLLEAARLAPSARNFQDWRLIVVRDKQLKAKIAECTNQPKVFAKAGAIIVACSVSDYVMKCGQAIAPIDVAIALEHIALAAVDQGLATCWIGSFEAGCVKKIIAAPAEAQLIELMAVGYSADGEKRKTTREPVEKIVAYDGWNF